MSTQVPNDEEYEEDQEPDAPAIQVDLSMLRKTLTSHVDAKAKIEADIPAEAITAGACELNAFALREELGQKHMAIINKVLETHSEHILEFSDFLDSRYKSMMRELCKQPADIEGADSAFSVTLNLTRSPRWRPRDAIIMKMASS